MQEVRLKCPSFAPKKEEGYVIFILLLFTSLVIRLGLEEQSFVFFSLFVLIAYESLLIDRENTQK